MSTQASIKIWNFKKYYVKHGTIDFCVSFIIYIFWWRCEYHMGFIFYKNTFFSIHLSEIGKIQEAKFVLKKRTYLCKTATKKSLMKLTYTLITGGAIVWNYFCFQWVDEETNFRWKIIVKEQKFSGIFIYKCTVVMQHRYIE